MCCYKFTLFFLCVLTLLSKGAVNGVVLRAYISQNGLHGEIEFSQKGESVVSIRTNLNPTLEHPDQVWQWTIHEFPVDYSEINPDRCDDSKLGKEIIDLTDELGFLTLPENKSSEFESTNNLLGEKGFWGKSLKLKSPENHKTICANIVSNDRTVERVAVVKFNSPISGSIYFRWIASKEFDHTDTFIQTDLYHIKNVKGATGEFTEHKWKIFVTDIFDSDNDKSEENCNILQLVFDPENKGDGRGIGDVDSRVGKVKVALDAGKKRFKTLYKDDGLTLLPSDLEGPHRTLYIVIFDEKHPDSFLACGKIRHHQARFARVLISSNGIKGVVELKQQSRFDPTWVNFNITSSDGNYESALKYASSVGTYQINDLPPIPPQTLEGETNVCYTTGNTYNPKNLDLKSVPPEGMGTQDQYGIGDLLGKLKGRTEYLNHKYLLPGLSNELSGSYWDIFLPLQGPNSVIHRTLAIFKRDEDKPFVCSAIVLYDPDTKYQTQMFTAQVILRYPLVGRVILRQPREQSWADTSIIFEYLVHADGANLNNSFEHRWAFHESAPNQDFYNWTGRCLSAGMVYNPFNVNYDNASTINNCTFADIGKCRVGDMSTRHQMLGVAGRKADGARISRKMFTDPLLPLSGPYSVLGKSLVIYDDHGPVARGERMACSIVGGLYRRKAVARDWHSNGDNIQLTGKLEFLQQTEYDVTNLEVKLEGLKDVNEYRVHLTPVEEDLEFPCEATTLYNTFNPLHIDENNSPPSGKGTTDEYELGDLSGKFGSLTGHSHYMGSFNDSLIPLFGPRSILGRSVVIHKQQRRWACSSLERGYSPSEARELRAIASFHHPAGFAYGYIRMTQLIYNDGSQSDTIIETKLRHPGVRDRNITRNHHWVVFVNPVGVDAAVQSTHTRCVAGGYRWNPYYTQLADPLNEDLYKQECGPDNPLRCHVGDLSARLGTINIGLGRQMFTDSNLPLEGVVNALGRSIVIMGPDYSSERFACANIEPDYDIVKYANIRKPPRFVVTQFVEDVRRVMGVPEWMLTVDTRKTKSLHHDACVQLFLHFKGPKAIQLDVDFSKLMATGKLEEPSIYMPGYVDQKRKKTLSYRQCGVRDPNEKQTKKFGPFTFHNGATTHSLSNTLCIFFTSVCVFMCLQ